MEKGFSWNVRRRKRKCKVLTFYHERIKNREVENIIIACLDNLNGFSQVIEAVYPKTEIQQ